MKRFVRYRMNFGSKWLTLSGVLMGVAFFLQAVEFLAFGGLQRSDVWHLLLFMILPMAFEAIWCVPLRSESWKRAEPHGIFSAIFCAMVMAQAILSGGVFAIVLSIVFFLACGAAAILISWGFFAHRALGMLVFAAAAVMHVLVVVLPQYLSAPGYMTLMRLVPTVCILLSIMCFFGGIQIEERNEE